jgi:hypothetical protein
MTRFADALAVVHETLRVLKATVPGFTEQWLRLPVDKRVVVVEGILETMEPKRLEGK